MGEGPDLPASVDDVPDWIEGITSALWKVRVEDDKPQQIPREEFFSLRCAFMEKLSAAAAAGDEAAQYVYRRWNKEGATL